MKYKDLCSIKNPKLTVISPSLNHARFLRETIESVANQTFRNFEHIIIDGGSTDETCKILIEYPHIRWISEKDENILEAYQKGFAMARGDYIIQCCISDGFLDRNWFKKCVELLDKDSEVSLVWGFPQYMSEEGNLLNVSFQEFFIDPPPQKKDFLSFWLATGFYLPEGNYCVRTEVIRSEFPDYNSPEDFQKVAHLGFIYQFMTRGYLPYFLPCVANFGRSHSDSRGKQLKALEVPATKKYYKYVRDYRRKILSGKITQLFQNGTSQTIGEVDKNSIRALRLKILRQRLLRMKVLRLDPYTLVYKLRNRVFR